MNFQTRIPNTFFLLVIISASYAQHLARKASKGE